MKKNNLFWIIIFSLLVFLFTGCAASVPLAPKKLDKQAKQFEPSSDKASIYITRRSSLGFAILFKIFIDGRMIGSIAYDTYHHLKMDPGNHTITVTSAVAQDTAKIYAEASELYFFDTVPQMRVFSVHVKLEKMNATEGMEVINDLELAKTIY